MKNIIITGGAVFLAKFFKQQDILLNFLNSFNFLIYESSVIRYFLFRILLGSLQMSNTFLK